MLPCHRLRQGKKEVERERSREGREENNERERERRETPHHQQFSIPSYSKICKKFTSFVVEQFDL